MFSKRYLHFRDNYNIVSIQQVFPIHAVMWFLIICSLIIYVWAGETYKYMPYKDIVFRLKDLQSKYPNLIKVDSAQNRYAKFGLDFSLGRCEVEEFVFILFYHLNDQLHSLYCSYW